MPNKLSTCQSSSFDTYSRAGGLVALLHPQRRSQMAGSAGTLALMVLAAIQAAMVIRVAFVSTLAGCSPASRCLLRVCWGVPASVADRLLRGFCVSGCARAGHLGDLPHSEPPCIRHNGPASHR
jgi:hypothetical protein